MKKANKTFLFLNLVLVLLILLVYDVFHFFPTTYEEARLWLGEKALAADFLMIKVKEPNLGSTVEFFIFKKDNIWFVSRKDEEIPRIYFADPEKIQSLLNGFAAIRKFGKPAKELSDSEFRKDGKPFRLILKKENKEIVDLELGDCFETKSECLIRHSNTKHAYLVPTDFTSRIGEGEFDFFLTIKPFAFLSIGNLESFVYKRKDQMVLSFLKKNNVWVSDHPISKQKLSNSKIDNLLLRVVSLSGLFAATESSLLQFKLKDTNTGESLSLIWQESGSKKEYSLTDMGSLNATGRVLRFAPNGQYVIMPFYVWDYWQNFDIRQLEE
ncbi:DUF4340 domain-containing protein [Leptospira ilyithenensis]|uniref:DUF4340 domain-containing protein n=1 Tax=Leptospira ilyithenensis TaxID=2484901 RepID=A0A4R9LLC7_9LEPT|nr:DUF4340 domain-containing protein [Leptospira ilyithenensis]TGN06954.1 hypothetical protein EHS11_17645 [Leptospira ilyithenensis]